jgi:hypothetical protein
MSLPLPIRLDRLQLGLDQVLTDALDTANGGPEVLWAYGQAVWEANVPDAGLVSLSMVGGPQPWNRSGKRGTLLNAAESIDVTVDSLEVGKRYSVYLNGFQYFTDATGADTVTTVRDRLRDQINADDLETATASDVSADTFRLTADSLGGMRTLRVVGALSTSNLVLDGDSVLVTEGTQTMLVNVQAFSKEREPRLGAWATIARVQAAFQSEDYIETLSRQGVGVWGKGPPTDLSAITGGAWETRVSFDLTLAAQAAWVRPISRIEAVQVAFTGTLEDGTPVASSTFTVNSP